MPTSMETYGHDFNNLKRAFVDFLHPHAVLRPCHAVRGQPARA